MSAEKNADLSLTLTHEPSKVNIKRLDFPVGINKTMSLKHQEIMDASTVPEEIIYLL